MGPPDRDQVTIFDTPAQFREWLTGHHDTVQELWVGFYKKHVPKTAMTYPESVEEALCFGWIDGLTYRIDDEVHTVRFTPRRRTSNWSAINIAKVAQLTDAGRMHPAGVRAFEQRDRRRDAAYSYENLPHDLPAEQEARLRSHADAWAYWKGQRPSYRRAATHWVLSATRAETRERRLATLVEDCAAGRPIKPLR
ncbi:MAG: YdeI/OmpD-associated family protein [Nocardioidaceae bacterium]